MTLTAAEFIAERAQHLRVISVRSASGGRVVALMLDGPYSGDVSKVVEHYRQCLADVLATEGIER